jgi:hypothetical protein
MIKEQDIDARLEELNRQGSPKFEGILELVKLRPRFEEIASEYMALLRSGRGSQYLPLKILGVFESLRARDIGRQIVRVAPSGYQVRRSWDKVRAETHNRTTYQVEKHSHSARALVRNPGAFVEQPIIRQPLDAVELPQWAGGDQSILDFSEVATVHLGFVGDDLVVAVDSNLELFIYGRESVDGSKKLNPSQFADYGYDPYSMDPERLIYGPILISGVRNKLCSCITHLHKHEIPPSADLLREVMAEVEQHLDYDSIIEAIDNWAKSRSKKLQDICVTFLPDEDLYLLPLSFIGIGNATPIVRQVGGVSIGLSLFCLKWEAQNYHWYTYPHLSKDAPKIAFFAADASMKLDLIRELDVIRRTVTDDNNFLAMVQCTRAEFLANYSVGDVCWFSGHGCFDLRTFEIGGEVLPFPLSGPNFYDGAVTNWELISTSIWNFSPLWLMVLNCCVVGKSVLVGPNPLGFVSAMHNTGSIAVVAAIFPVFDAVSIEFAEHLTKAISQYYNSMKFPRARAFQEAISRTIGENDSLSLENCAQVAPYVLWGLP